ncbi:hypothetical protein H072_7609 [Dactylellina haptotyla CBS 200.50]|uniref:Helicase ATP-binding domain-containing protein n=1 Tax=Dactylellina haptotyla (strain CBS 200.50) TaxID=1284197 RepID=S8A6Y0_DACHA|nr:hypothetical protein H072_7609 [Dactylellina haptotyla CBS 200.50]
MDLVARASSSKFNNVEIAIKSPSPSKTSESNVHGKAQVVLRSPEPEIVNIDRSDGVDPIPFPQHISNKLFGSQIEGVQFLWREIVQNEGGALLAHTMGMGKTAQIVTLLYIISQVEKSDDEKIFTQLPENLCGDLHVLIVAPPGLLQNWRQEFCKWIPETSDEQLLQFFVPGDEKNPGQRAEVFRAWSESGGVLLMGYQMLRDYVFGPANKRKPGAGNPKGRKAKRAKLPRKAKKEYTEQGNSGDESQEPYSEAEELRNIILQKPCIVIADEAHAIKNENSMMSKSLNLIQTKSRIALTGSPLANNLKEYYCMVDWIASGLLPAWEKFRNFFVHPIEAGLYEESSDAEKASSQRRLAILRYKMATKIHRRDLSQIRHQLPEKTEFLITVELTKLQKNIYSRFVKRVVEANRGREDEEAEKKDPLEIKGFFDHVKSMRILLNHPKIFYDVFNERAKANGRKEGIKGFDTFATLFESTVCGVEKDEGRDCFDDPKHSNRMMCLFQIVELAEIMNEKVLVFSTSVPTLNYIQEQLKSRGIATTRIDGQTKPALRQAITKSFDNDEGANIMLISTKAGGVGLNITAASRVVIFDFDFSPQDQEQAIGRAYRLGQMKPVYVYRFKVGGTFEDAMTNKARFKMSLAARVVDSSKPVKLAKLGRKKEYFNPPGECRQEDLSEFMKEYKDPLLQVLVASGLVKGIDLQDTFDVGDDQMDENEEKLFQEDLDALSKLEGPRDHHDEKDADADFGDLEEEEEEEEEGESDAEEEGASIE